MAGSARGTRTYCSSAYTSCCRCAENRLQPKLAPRSPTPRALQEAVQLQRLRHAAVVGFVGVGVRSRTGLLLMEYMEGRDLYT